MSQISTHQPSVTATRFCPVSGESFLEEVFNAITHGLGLILSVIGMIALVVMASYYGDAWLITGCTIYGVSLVLLYAASTFYHLSWSIRMKKVFRVLDHAFIYLLIAGTYTPFTLGPLKGAFGWTLFIIVWSVTAVGIVLKAIDLNRWGKLSTLSYLTLGWMGVVAFYPLLNEIALPGLLWVVAGGLAYSIGTIFFALNRMPFNHSIWHLFVLGGSACHFTSIFVYVIPYS